MDSEPSPDSLRPTKRQRRLPKQFRVFSLDMHDRRLRDFLPQPPLPLPPPSVNTEGSSSIPSVAPATAPEVADLIRIPSPSQQHTSNGVPGCLRRVLQTARNSFGLLRRYFAQKFPSHDPESGVDISDLSDIVKVNPQTLGTSSTFGPYPNKSSFLLGDWYWNSAQKSQRDLTNLVKIVSSDDFRPAEIKVTNWASVNDRLALDDSSPDEEWMDEDAGWRTTPVNIAVPFHRHTDTPGPRDYAVANFHHRPLVSIIREKIRNPSHHPGFHYEPYELHWQPNVGPTEETQRVYGELYTSPAFIDAHNALQESPGEPGCDLPLVVVALMFWSDATQLTNFGDAKLWPLYIGNESKYQRCKPSLNRCEHVAYFESVSHVFSSCYLMQFVLQLPDSFKDFANKHSGSKKLKPELTSHCRRECIHAQWKIILDDEFWDAYEHGIVIECCDGITCRFYPRILTYSADYPEK
jgi:hypothetical protein